MSKFGLISTPEDKAVKLMLGDKLSANDVSDKLREEGIDLSPQKLRTIKQNAFQALVSEQRDEYMSDFLLESAKKVIMLFDDIYQRYDNLFQRLEAQMIEKGKDNTFEQTVVLTQMKSMLYMALNRLGEFKKAIERININKVNVINNTDVMIAIKTNQERLFDAMEPEYKDGKLIFHSPKGELIDAFYKWKFKQKRKEQPNESHEGILQE